MQTMRRVRVVSALVASLALGCRDEPLVAPEAGTSTRPAYSNGADSRALPHMVVLREERAPASSFLAAVARLGGRLERRHDAIGIVTMRGLSDRAVATLATRSDVEGISRDMMVQWLPLPERFGASGGPRVVTQGDQSTASYFSNWQWNIRQISADDAWLVSPQGGGALVCILDTGVDPDHVDLSGRLDLGTSASVVGSEPYLADHNFHGTFVAALVASNGVYMASVAPEARLCAVKVLNGEGNGSFDEVIAGTMHAAQVGADVINMSFGTNLPRSDPGTRVLVSALQRAVRFAVRRGALVVAGAGNDGLDLDQSEDIFVPGQLAGVLSVGATGPLNQTDFDRLASYSNFGKHAVDLMAPGGENPAISGNLHDAIVSACSRFVTFEDCSAGSAYLLGVGTSFAAPQVAGAAAVVESMLPGDQNGSQLETCLFAGADQPDGKILSPLYGRGRLNVLRSVQSPGCGLGVVVNPATQLVFTIQPSTTVAHSPITPAVTVVVQKTSDGSTRTSFQGSVTVAISLNVGGGTLLGTFNRPVVDGVATFDDLSIDVPGTGFTLRATATSATGPTPGDAVSDPFDITTEGATSLTGSMSVARRDHQAVLLDNGKVLIVGGTGGGADLYDPTTEAFTNLGPTVFGHPQAATATKLTDGRVLVVGGTSDPMSAEIFDPATNTFRPIVATATASRTAHTATLLADGRVLLAGGQYQVGGRPQSHAAAEIFDPADESFTPVGDLTRHRYGHAATLLPDGRVLLVGGTQVTVLGSGDCLSSAELFDPVTETFSLTGSLAEGRCAPMFTGITLLTDGRVLVLGWSSSRAELYNPASGTFSSTGSMTSPHTAGSATLLLDGRVLISGGTVGGSVTAVAELYDPIPGTFTLATSLVVPRLQHSATRLLDGRVLIAGGFDSAIDADRNSAELYVVSIPALP